VAAIAEIVAGRAQEPELGARAAGAAEHEILMRPDGGAKIRGFGNVALHDATPTSRERDGGPEWDVRVEI
jgi:hypothetical protein